MLALLVIVCAAGVSVTAQSGGGKVYDTRDPVVCTSKKLPAKGAPSNAQLLDYVRCRNEVIANGNIWLLQNLVVEIGVSRPYSAYSDSGNGDIDNYQPVYPIRGTYDGYLCRPPGSDGAPAGHNCTETKAATYAGICYKTTFGDWSCPVHGTSAPFAGQQLNVAPPK